jgi:hypothetical protein
MLALRYAALLAIIVWIGGLVSVGAIAAPSIFEVVALRNIADGRVLAGAIFGEVLRRFHVVSYACGGLILLTLIARAVLGPRPRRFAIRLAIAAVMLGATLYSGLVVSRAIAEVQREIGANVSPSTLPEGDARRAAFGRLHGRSTMLQLVPLAGGMLLVFWELKD